MKREAAASLPGANSATSALNSETETETQAALGPCPALTKPWMSPARPGCPLCSLTYHVCDTMVSETPSSKSPSWAWRTARMAVGRAWSSGTLALLSGALSRASLLLKGWSVCGTYLGCSSHFSWYCSGFYLLLSFYFTISHLSCSTCANKEDLVLTVIHLAKIISLAKRAIFKGSWQ